MIEKSNLIFIVGCPRSGTTWIWGLFTSHEDVEPLNIEDFNPLKRSIVDGKRVTTETGAFEYNNDKLVLDTIKKKMEDFPGKTLIEKTPSHALKTDKIFKLFPKARIVWVLRDPRAIVSSMFNSKAVEFNLNFDEIIINVRKYFDTYNRVKRDKRIYTIKYEDLKRNRAIEVEKMFNEFGLNTDSIGKVLLENYLRVKVEREGVFRTGEIDSYKRDLTKYEIKK